MPSTGSILLDLRKEPRAENARRVAVAFKAVLTEWLTADEMAAVTARNRAEVNPHVCHSHDFCDANMAMDEAFRKVFGRPASDYLDAAEGTLDEMPWEIWNDAWAIFARETRDGGSN